MNPMKGIIYAMLGVLAVSVGPRTLLQGQSCGTCGQSRESAAAPVCPSPCECTVLVPQTVIEYCPKTVTRYRQETRQRMITVYRDVPTTQTVEEEYTVMVPEVRRRTVEETINRPVYHDVELRVTAMAPQIETRQATRTVCRMVPVQEERTVSETVDVGEADRPVVIRTVGYQRETAVDALPPPTTLRDASPTGAANVGACSSCGQPACNTCAPAVLQRKVCTTCMKPASEQETIEYPVTHFQPNARSETVSYYEYEPEKVARDEEYTVEVPQKKVRTREVTVMQTVAEQKPQVYTVPVSYEVQVQVPVPVLRWVPQPATPSCGTCDGT